MPAGAGVGTCGSRGKTASFCGMRAIDAVDGLHRLGEAGGRGHSLAKAVGGGPTRPFLHIGTCGGQHIERLRHLQPSRARAATDRHKGRCPVRGDGRSGSSGRLAGCLPCNACGGTHHVSSAHGGGRAVQGKPLLHGAQLGLHPAAGETVEGEWATWDPHVQATSQLTKSSTRRSSQRWSTVNALQACLAAWTRLRPASRPPQGSERTPARPCAQ